MVFEIGAQVGAYQILEKIGSGGMATVYKARQPRLDRDVAIKVMHQTIAQDVNFLARFEREARIVASLDHPNIVPIYDYDEHEGQPYLVMKYVRGHTLKDLLREGALRTTDIVRILTAVGSALEYAHKRGVLHRDIKPSNIIIDERGEAYLMDFGLARIAQAGESTMSADVMLGTPHYISPEQAQGNKDLDARTDVYSLGIVLYEMLTGRVPFVGDTSYAIIHAQITESPIPPRQLNPTITPPVEAVVLKALAKSRNERYASPMELVDAFREALAQGDAPASFQNANNINAQSQRATPPNVHFHPNVSAPPPPKISVSKPKSGANSKWQDDLRRAGSEIRDAMKTAREEIKKAIDEVKKEGSWGNQNSDTHTPSGWKPGAKWRTAPDGTKGFFTDKEIERMEEEGMTQEEVIRKRVEEKLEERNGLIIHGTAFVLINTMLFLIWLFNGLGFPWFMIPLLGWGIGMFAHYMDYYQNYGAGREKREQLIAREMERERARMNASGIYEKAKNDFDDAPRLRLTEDGELSESFIQELEDDEYRRRR